MLMFKTSVVAAFAAIVITAAALARKDGDSNLLNGRAYDDEGNPYGFVPVGLSTTPVVATTVGADTTANSILTPAATGSTKESSYLAPSGYEYPSSVGASYTSTVVITKTTTISKDVATTFVLKTSDTPSINVLVSCTNQSTSAITMAPLPTLGSIQPAGTRPAVSYLFFTYTPEASATTSTGGNSTLATGTMSGGGMPLGTGYASTSADSNITVAVSPTASNTPVGNDGGQTLGVSAAMVVLVIGNMVLLL